MTSPADLVDLRAALRSVLLADSAISSLVGNVRVHGVRIPSGVMPGPSIVYTMITENTDHVMSGPSGLVTARFQIDAWATSGDVAANLALLVKARLDGYQGPMVYGTDSPPDLVMVHGVFASNAMHDYDATSNLYRSSRDYEISYWER